MKAAGLLEAPLAIVDVETTGAHPGWDRVTEIAVIEINGGAQGGEVAAEWSTLVNPGTSIPPAIQALTGITNAMVADAPSFDDLAPGLYERLEGRIFVAHNARFDYGFLRHEFERAGLRFQARTLCTVKLSRRLYPGHARHNLDSLIDRHNLQCSARHRALGDAQAVWQFLRVAAEERGVEALRNVACQLAQLPALPAHLERAAVDEIPEAPGVYLFYGENDTPLYVGKSVAMRSRVLQHFSGDVHSPREAQIAREVRRIEWRRTGGELGALLLEARLVKELLPVFNRQPRRAAAALAGLKTAAWPWRGPIAIVEEDRDRDAADLHVVHHWCLLGTAHSEAEVADLLEGEPRPQFDLDHYKILARHLSRGRAKVIELSAVLH